VVRKDDPTSSERTYRQVPAQMTPEDFEVWFSRLYPDLTGRAATGTPQQWHERYERLRRAFDRHREERRP
jgi:hypothetical protein